MHTENEQNKPPRKSGPPAVRAKPGEQVAVNRTLHCNMKLFEDESGEYYPVVDRMDQVSLVRGEYIPIGNRFHYPKQWGRKYAAVKLLEHKIAIEQDIVNRANAELEKLQRCLDRVKDWSEGDE